MINITSTTPPLEMLEICHDATAIPSVLIAFISSLIIFPIVTFFMVDRERTDYRKLLWIWILSAIILGMVVGGVIYFPNTVQSISNWIF